MKKTLLTITAFVTLIFSTGLIAQTTFNYTGAMQTYTVPNGVNQITIEVWGAQGGQGGGNGGLGAFVTGELDVTPGQTLNIYVGGMGGTPTAGWNGGGSGEAASNPAGGGGGASDVRVGGTALTDRVIVAGGGGGGAQGDGGYGGGLVGGQGSTNGAGTWAEGGTQTAGGAGGLYDNGSCAPGAWAFDGALGVGGDGIIGVGSCTNWGGSGGGGGYYGGGGMQINGAGGGSSYIDGVNNGTMADGIQSGDGQIIITENCNVSTIDLNITQVDVTLTADQVGATYQWLDCDSSYAVVTGETNQSFTSTVSGNFAVEITIGSCVDTSACFLVDLSNVSQLELSPVSVHPNPATEELFVEGLDKLIGFESLSVISASGEIVIEDNSYKDYLRIAKLDKGIYFVRIKHENGIETIKFIKD